MPSPDRTLPMTRRTPHGTAVLALSILALFVSLLAACGAEKPGGGHARLAGSVTVADTIDAGGDQAGFEIVVLATPAGDLDTLAVAHSDTAGVFAVEVRVPERGVYPLVISRGGSRLHIGEVVLADGDSISMRARFPLDGRGLRIVSKENSAWTAYRNAKALYNRTVLGLLQSGGYSTSAMQQSVTQLANILWSLRDLYPGTLGATVAEAECVVLLESWNDSLAVSRYHTLGADHPSIVGLSQAVRRSLARLDGLDASVAFLRATADSVSHEDGLAIRSEIVAAYRDSLDRTRALEEARSLLADGRGTDWERWAGNAVYELENLMPGMSAPAFSALDSYGRPVTLESLSGRTVLLEFFSPADETYLRELPERQLLIGALRGRRFAAVSVSLEPDSSLNEALLEGRNLLGTFVFDPDGIEGSLARAYNVNTLPTRVLIDREGKLLSRYSGPALPSVRNDLAGIFGAGSVDR